MSVEQFRAIVNIAREGGFEVVLLNEALPT